MTTIQRGADSLDLTSQAVATACVVPQQTVAWQAKNCLYPKGGEIVFWGRYFQNADFPTNAWQLIEARALADQDVSWVVPISQPGQGRISGTYADGQTDGLAFIQNVKNALINMNQIAVPDTNRVDCFLDIEANFFISSTYWQGWADAVNLAEYPAGSGILPFYACAYVGSIGTGTGTTNCNTIQGPKTPFGIWSNQPQLSGGCVVACDLPGPAWAPNSCSIAATVLWQYADEVVCSTSCGRNTDVDLNLTSPTVGGSLRQDVTDHLAFLRSGDLTPAVAAQKSGTQIDVVVRGANGRIYRITRPAPGQAWSTWEEIVGLSVEAASNPTAFWRSSGGQLQLEVFVRGVDKTYWRNFFRLGAWSGWQRVADGSDALQSSPSADGPAAGQIHTLYAALGGTSVKQRYIADGGAWQIFDLGAPIGQGVASAPGGTWWNGDNKYEVFIRGTDNNIYNKEWDSVTGWTAGWFASAGVTSQVQPIATGRGLSEMYVFFVPVGGTTIQYRGFNTSLGWLAVTDLGAPTGKGVVSAAGAGWSQSGTQLDVATRASDNFLWVRSNNGAWSPWSQVASYPGLT